MSTRIKIQPDIFFEMRPVFTLEEYAEAVEKENEIQAARNQLRYYQRRGRVKRVANGVFASIPVYRDPDTFSPDPYLVGGAQRPGAIFCYHSAFDLLGAGHSIWTQVTAFSSSQGARNQLGHYSLRFLPDPKPLREDGRRSLGTRRIDREGRSLLITGPERTLVEGFRSLRWVGGIHELLQCASGFGVLDLELLASVLQAYGKRNLWSRVGWFLERYRDRFYISDEVLDDYRSRGINAPTYLYPGQRGGSLLDRWNLIVPANLADSTDA